MRLVSLPQWLVYTGILASAIVHSLKASKIHVALEVLDATKSGLLHLRCTILQSEGQLNRIVWRKDQKLLVHVALHNLPYHTQQTTSVGRNVTILWNRTVPCQDFKLYGPTEADEGIYRCLVLERSNTETLDSDSAQTWVKLSVVPQARPFITHKNQNITSDCDGLPYAIVKGLKEKQLNLTCKTFPSYPKSKVTFNISAYYESDLRRECRNVKVMRTYENPSNQSNGLISTETSISIQTSPSCTINTTCIVHSPGSTPGVWIRNEICAFIQIETSNHSLTIEIVLSVVCPLFIAAAVIICILMKRRLKFPKRKEQETGVPEQRDRCNTTDVEFRDTDDRAQRDLNNVNMPSTSTGETLPVRNRKKDFTDAVVHGIHSYDNSSPAYTVDTSQKVESAQNPILKLTDISEEEDDSDDQTVISRPEGYLDRDIRNAADEGYRTSERSLSDSLENLISSTGVADTTGPHDNTDSEANETLPLLHRSIDLDFDEKGGPSEQNVPPPQLLVEVRESLEKYSRRLYQKEPPIQRRKMFRNYSCSDAE